MEPRATLAPRQAVQPRHRHGTFALLAAVGEQRVHRIRAEARLGLLGAGRLEDRSEAHTEPGSPVRSVLEPVRAMGRLSTVSYGASNAGSQQLGAASWFRVQPE